MEVSCTEFRQSMIDKDSETDLLKSELANLKNSQTQSAALAIESQESDRTEQNSKLSILEAEKKGLTSSLQDTTRTFTKAKEDFEEWQAKCKNELKVLKCQNGELSDKNGNLEMSLGARELILSQKEDS
jgi:hypothetical protein